jgi:hypothetical protein
MTDGPYDFAREDREALEETTDRVVWVGNQARDADDVPSRSDLADEP